MDLMVAFAGRTAAANSLKQQDSHLLPVELSRQDLVLDVVQRHRKLPFSSYEWVGWKFTWLNYSKGKKVFSMVSARVFWNGKTSTGQRSEHLAEGVLCDGRGKKIPRKSSPTCDDWKGISCFSSGFNLLWMDPNVVGSLLFKVTSMLAAFPC